MSNIPTAQSNSLHAKFSTLGKKLGAYYTTKRDYHALDLSRDDFSPSAFHAQSAQAWQQLLGSKGSSIQRLLETLVPAEHLQAFSEGVYGKLANWARQWALHDLNKDARFAQLAHMSTAEKEAFAAEVSDHNRLLAAAGAVTAFFGLAGVVADTAWMLLVSLRSVYQLAIIHGKPCDGEMGITMAYRVLSGAKLDKVQEKQVIITALTLAHMTLKSAQHSGVEAELKRLGGRYQVGHLELLNKYLNLDGLNNRFLRAVLPVAAAAVSVHYNEQLIEEVMGTAQATFNQAPLLIDHQ